MISSVCSICQQSQTCRLEILRQQNPSDVDVAITPEELEGLDEASIQALYNQRVAEERAKNAREVGCLFQGHVMRFVLFRLKF